MGGGLVEVHFRIQHFLYQKNVEMEIILHSLRLNTREKQRDFSHEVLEVS